MYHFFSATTADCLPTAWNANVSASSFNWPFSLRWFMSTTCFDLVISSRSILIARYKKKEDEKMVRRPSFFFPFSAVHRSSSRPKPTAHCWRLSVPRQIDCRFIFLVCLSLSFRRQKRPWLLFSCWNGHDFRRFSRSDRTLESGKRKAPKQMRESQKEKENASWLTNWLTGVAGLASVASD